MSQPNQVSPIPSEYTQITTATTTTVVGASIFDGIYVSIGGTGSAVTIYDNTAASGTVLVNAVATTAVGALTLGIPGDGIQLKNGLTVVTTGSPAATVNIFYGRSIP